jgi:hypothetical protein
MYMADNDNDLYKAFDLSKPTVEVRNKKAEPILMYEEQLLTDLKELENILKEIDRLKKQSKTGKDWRVVMMFIAGQKPRISEMLARSRRIYAQEFGNSYDSQYQDASPSNKTAEIRARRDAALAYETQERFDRTWRDLEALTWACKDVAGSLDEEGHAAIFEAYPEELF